MRKNDCVEPLSEVMILWGMPLFTNTPFTEVTEVGGPLEKGTMRKNKKKDLITVKRKSVRIA